MVKVKKNWEGNRLIENKRTDVIHPNKTRILQCIKIFQHGARNKKKTKSIRHLKKYRKVQGNRRRNYIYARF